MEIAMLAGTAAAGSGTAAAAGTAAAGATAAAGGLSMASILPTLKVGLSLASMAGDIFGGISEGRAAADQLTQQAEQDLMNARQEELAGKQEQNDITQNLIQTIATQRLAFASGGGDFSFGSPAALERNRTRLAEMQLSTSRDNTRLKTLARRRQAYLNLSRRSQAQSAPVMAGLASAGKTAMEVLR